MEQRRILGSGNSQGLNTIGQHLIAHSFEIRQLLAGLITVLLKDILVVVNRTSIDSRSRNAVENVIHIADAADHGLFAVLLEQGHISDIGQRHYIIFRNNTLQDAVLGAPVPEHIGALVGAERG